MNIKIHARQMELSDSLRDYAERHIADQLTTIYKGQAATLDIEFSEAVGGRERICKVTVFIPKGKTIVASAQDANVFAAVDICADKISRGLRHYKEKRQDAVRQGPRPSDSLVSQAPVGDEYEEDEHDFHDAHDEPTVPDSNSDRPSV